MLHLYQIMGSVYRKIYVYNREKLPNAHAQYYMIEK
jgi:hypothetical protein